MNSERRPRMLGIITSVACFLAVIARSVESANLDAEQRSLDGGQDIRTKRSPGYFYDAPYHAFAGPGGPRASPVDEFYGQETPSHGFYADNHLGGQPTSSFASVNQTSCGDRFDDTCVQSRYRTIDGSCNNKYHPTWGQANTRYGRLFPFNYADGIHAPTRATSGNELPPARAVSLAMFPPGTNPDVQFTLSMMQFGQIVTHDMAMIDGTTQSRSHPTRCCTDEGRLVLEALNSPLCFPIDLPKHDPLYRQKGAECMNFVRSNTDLDRGCTGLDQPAEQLTVVTSYLDASHLYGSNQETTDSLRTKNGGLLASEFRNGREWPPPAANKSATCDVQSDNEVCYLAGDARANQNPQLTIFQVLYLREHNRIARTLGRVNPHWNDETIFQETRRIVIAEHQHITYYEYLTYLLGTDNLLRRRIIYNNPKGYVNDYSPDTNPAVLNEHSTGAFRYFHSSIAGHLDLVDERRCPFAGGSLRLSDHFDRPGIIEVGNVMGDLIRSLGTQSEETNDQIFDEEITRFLFRNADGEGSDLRAFDIQRNRDHGLASYNDARQHCGLPRAQSWSDFRDLISPVNIDRLSKLYESHEDVDLTVGGSLERHVPGTLAGPTFGCILQEQFYRTRVGDRYWYESGDVHSAFTVEQLQQLRKSSLAKFFCNNDDDIRSMQRFAFVLPSKNNPIYRCEELPDIDLSHWKDLNGPAYHGNGYQNEYYH